MGKAATLNGHALDKYPVMESEYNGHLGRKIAIGGSILGAAALGTFLGYKALTNDSPKNTAEETQKLYNPKKQEQVIRNPNESRNLVINDLKKQMGEDAKAAPQPNEEVYGGHFTKKDFAEAVEPGFKRWVGPDVHITPDEIKLTPLTLKDLERLYRRDFGYKEEMSTAEAAKRYLKFYGYKGPGFDVDVFIDERPNSGFGWEREFVFENTEGRLVTAIVSLVDW
jgi:hypothetical protein